MSSLSSHSRQLCALAMSIAAHALLMYAVGISSRFTQPEKSMRPHDLKVSILQSAVNKLAVNSPVKSGSRPENRQPVPASRGAAVRRPLQQQSQAQPQAAFPPAQIEAPVAAAIPLIEILAPSEPYYFKISELTEKPQVISDLPPDFALLLSGQSFQSAIVRLLINEAGEIDQVIFDESSFSEANQRLIREAVLKMRFAPGKIEDGPVKTEMRIEIALDGAGP